jgi:hypothetical protein
MKSMFADFALLVGRHGLPRSSRERALKPFILVLLLLAAGLAATTLARRGEYAPYGNQESERQIDQAGSSLCDRFQFASATEQANECKAALADLRRRHESALLH